MGDIPSDPYAFLITRPERTEKTSVEEVLIVDINELDGGGDTGIAPESSKVEIEAKVWAKSSGLSKEEMATVLSEQMKGGREVTIKFLEWLLAG